MKILKIVPSALAVLALSTFGGCATSTESSRMTPSGREASELAFQYRQQAAELRQMAARLELEAQIYAQRQDQEQAKRTSALAKDMRVGADAAEEQAREYRRQVPHGMVY
jgi:hypothetical protein